MKTKAIDVANHYRSQIYLLAAASSVVTLIVSGITNWREGLGVVAALQAVVVVLILISVPFAFRKMYIQTMAITLTSVLAIQLLFNSTQFSGSGPAPYPGLLAVIVLFSLLVEGKWKFTLFFWLSFGTVIVLTLLGLNDLAVGSLVKYGIVITATWLYLLLHKKYTEDQTATLLSMTQQLETAEGASSSHANDMEQQATELEKQRQELEEKNKQLEKLNAAMSGREVRMAELKKRIAELEGKE